VNEHGDERGALEQGVGSPQGIAVTAEEELGQEESKEDEEDEEDEEEGGEEEDDEQGEDGEGEETAGGEAGIDDSFEERVASMLCDETSDRDKPLGPPLPDEPSRGGLRIGEEVALCGLVTSHEFNGRKGLVLRWSDENERYHIAVHGVHSLLAITPCHLRRLDGASRSSPPHAPPSAAAALAPPANAANAAEPSASAQCSEGAQLGSKATSTSPGRSSTAELDAMLAQPVPGIDVERVVASPTAAEGEAHSEHMSLLASLVPLVEEEAMPIGTVQREVSPELLWGREFNDDEIEIEDARNIDEMPLHVKCLWNGGEAGGRGREWRADRAEPQTRAHAA
jgi:hypothetical protein